MPINKQQLSESLAAEVRVILLEGEKLKTLTDKQFNQKRSDGGWSVAQVLFHLNFYSDYYLPILENATKDDQVEQLQYKPGWLGSYFTKLMAPDEGGNVKRKMKSPSNATPHEREYPKSILDKFLNDQQRLLQILKRINGMDMNKKLPISISRMIKLKSGDVLRFVIAHEQRHVIQIKRLLKEM